MQQAIFVHFPTQEVEYKFYNRALSTMKFSRESFDAFNQQVKGQLATSTFPPPSLSVLFTSPSSLPSLDIYIALSTISLTSDELSWLETTCPYFHPTYLAFLSALRLDPANQVVATFVPQPHFGKDMGDIEIIIKGKWVETILYEVSFPLISLQGGRRLDV